MLTFFCKGDEELLLVLEKEIICMNTDLKQERLMVKDIAEILGHNRIETTEKYYISSTTEDKKKVTEIFEKNIKDSLR